MQNKGAIRLVAILLILACLWQLSFTLVSSIQNSKANKYAEAAAQKEQRSPAFEKIAETDRAYYLDSIRKDQQRRYVDSVSTEKVYFGYTFKDVQAKEINLGLDLKGGMNVMLQVQLQDLVKALATEESRKDPNFQQAIEQASARANRGESDYIALFGEEWDKVTGKADLYHVFSTEDMGERIKPGMSSSEILAEISRQAGEQVDNSYNVLRNRIDRFGVTQPSIQKVGSSGRILVELPGVKEPERVRKLLQGTASLEFWPTYVNNDPLIIDGIEEANRVIAQILKDEKDVAPAEGEADEAAVSSEDAYREENPLKAVLSVLQDGSTACIGYASAVDTARINRWFAIPRVAECFPPEFAPMWSVKASDRLSVDNYFELVAIRRESEKAPIDGGDISDSRVSYNPQHNGEPSVSMNMYGRGASEWARLTRQNIGKQIAIVLDGTVYSYPVVNQEISGGSSEISGHFTVEEATDLVNVLKSGKLPAPAKIVQEQVVGPTLGAKSIKDGMISFIIAFVLVLLYMLFFYRGAGVAADVALLANVVLLFGTLASFGAVLTLPGIAGLVLTLGMAVDANVIIYERIKEEIKAGKGLSKAVADGYSNAYSAIIDGQLTTLLTGVVLFFFGSGPVKGFATTLIIGIITSVLTSIFITRLIFDRRLAKGKNITFDSALTRNFLKNTHVDFVGKRKWSYCISGVLILVALVSIFTKGFTYGVDFTGGRTYVVRFDKPVVAEEVRSAVNDVFSLADDQTGSVEVKQFGGESQMKITTSYKVDDKSQDVDDEIEGMLFTALKGFYADQSMQLDDFKNTVENPNGIISSDKVDASIASDIRRDAIISVILALLIIFGYIAVRFKGWTWGLGGVVSLAHTAIIVIGFFSLFTGILPFNLDVDQTFIAAILTIIGYAINDNVVIFDRIRENKLLHPNADFKETVNSSLNATLTRTVNTSVSTLLPMVAIAIWGGESIRGLSVALILGILIGTYASIMIGTPVMFDAARKDASKKVVKK